MSSNQSGPIAAIEVAGGEEGEGEVQSAHRELHRMIARGASFSGRERNCAFLNLGDGSFADVSASVGFDFMDDARAVVTLDYDRDGDLDVVTTNRTAPRLRVLLNRSERLMPRNPSVTFKLDAGPGNPDGVGATLTVTPEGGAPLVRTVCAGSGFLGMSSTALVVGLGELGTISRVEVLWPGGQRESFVGVQAGGAFVLRRGKGAAEPWARPAAPFGLDSRPRLVTPDGASDGAGCGAASSAFLTVPEPLPSLEAPAWTSMGGEARGVSGSSGPSVLTLWSVDCPLCRMELVALANETFDYPLALVSVDGVIAKAAGDDADAELIAERGDVIGPCEAAPGRARREVGVAGYELIEALQVAVDRPFPRDTDLALPVTFVLDGSGAIASIHRGPMDPEVIRAELRFLASEDAQDPEARRARIAPFEGQWLAPAPNSSVAALARAWVEEGLVDAALDLLVRAEASGDLRPSTPVGNAAARAAGEAGRRLFADGDLVRAVEAAELTSRLRPDWARGHFNRGVILEAAGEDARAEAAYTRTLDLRKRYWRALANRGLLRGRLGRAAEGRRDIEAAMGLLPKDATAADQKLLQGMLDSLTGG